MLIRGLIMKKHNYPSISPGHGPYFYSFSIIIPVAPNENYTKTLNAIKKFNYNFNKVEVIIIRGNQPSIQRNIASQKAKNEILYFLDNDSIPGKNNLVILNHLLNQSKDCAVIGGPSLSPENVSLVQKTINQALGSFIGSAYSRSRYASIGSTRESNELELILCNMAIRKNVFRRLKGFNPNLYPNEENELMNRLQKINQKLYYTPDLIVYRDHRNNVLKFIKQIFTYGRGRGEQVSIHWNNLTFFPLASLGFDIYLISLLLIPYPIKFVPLIFYLMLILGISFYKNYKNIQLLFYLPFIYFIIHSMYGIGFISGLTKSLLKIKTKKEKFWYKMERIKTKE